MKNKWQQPMVMTKLMEWAFVATVFFSIWTATITGSIKAPFLEKWKEQILYLPIILVFAFGVYAASVVLYRVFTFNNCEEAAKELQQQIQEAKTDLRKHGISLKED